MNFRTVRLSDVVIEDRRIVAPDSSDALRLSYLGLEQIEAGTGRILSYDGNSAEGKSTTFRFDERHVLYGKLRPYLNKVAVPDREGRCSTEIIPLLPTGVDRVLLSLILRSDRFVSAAMNDKTGSRMPRADMDALLLMDARIPDTEQDQRHVAARLSCQLAEVDKARQSAGKQTEDILLIRSRVLRDVFSSLHDTPLKVLGDHAPTTSGTTPPRGNKAYWSPAEVLWVKTGEVAFAPITTTEEAVSRLALKECSLSLLPPKTVLVAMIGQGKTRGQSALLEIEATTNQNCFAVLPSETWQPEFLYYWFVANYQNLRNLSSDRGGSQSALNGALLKALEVPAPDHDTQGRIVQRVQAALIEVDAMQSASQKMLKDLEQLPQRILAQAFDS